MGVKIIAFDDNGFAGTKDYAGHIAAAQGVRGWSFQPYFGGPASLVQRINGELARANDCLSDLQIYAHGTPISCDGFSLATAAAWGQALMGVTSWCDTASIVLNSCNTGLKDHQGRGPVAEALANAMPHNANTFDHKITVYGLKGYGRGSNAAGTLTVEREITEGYWKRTSGWPFWRWVTTAVHYAYPGAVDASGTTGMASFKNGNW